MRRTSSSLETRYGNSSSSVQRERLYLRLRLRSASWECSAQWCAVGVLFFVVEGKRRALLQSTELRALKDLRTGATEKKSRDLRGTGVQLLRMPREAKTTLTMD